MAIGSRHVRLQWQITFCRIRLCRSTRKHLSISNVSDIPFLSSLQTHLVALSPFLCSRLAPILILVVQFSDCTLHGIGSAGLCVNCVAAERKEPTCLLSLKVRPWARDPQRARVGLPKANGPSRGHRARLRCSAVTPPSSPSALPLCPPVPPNSLSLPHRRSSSRAS